MQQIFSTYYMLDIALETKNAEPTQPSKSCSRETS